MSSTDIVRGVRTLIQNKLLPHVPVRWNEQVRFGLEAYALREFTSATGNARMVVANPNTASSKARRLLGNMKLAEIFGVVFDGFGLVRPGSYVNIDHSDMNGLMVLAGAIQTRHGRALPCLLETTYSERLSGRDDELPRKRRLRWDMQASRQTQCFTGHAIDALQDFHDRLDFWPRLVFDRGFGNESIVTHLHAEGATFYIRLKEGRYVQCDGEQLAVDQLPAKDTTIQLFGLTLRVVRSPKSRRCKDPWYILTNDFSSSRTKIVRIYYHRFEIEEDFKDMKYIWELKRTRLNRPNSLKVMLWFVALGIALLYVALKPTKRMTYAPHTKKRRSWLRQAYEAWQRAVTESMKLTG